MEFNFFSFFFLSLQAEGPPVQVEPVDLSLRSPRGKSEQVLFIFVVDDVWQLVWSVYVLVCKLTDIYWCRQ